MRRLEASLKAVADPTRTRILKLLEAGPLCVCQVQAVLALAPSTVSRHLAILKSAELVLDERDGKWIHYRLADAGGHPYAAGLFGLLTGALDRDPRIVADRRRLREVLRVPVDELCRLPGRPGPAAGRPASRPAGAGRAGRPRRTGVVDG